MENKMISITSQRAEIHTKQKEAAQLVEQASRELTAAVNERDRLQNICIVFEKNEGHEPPYSEFAKAVLAIDRAAAKLDGAEKEALQADQVARETLHSLSIQEATLRREYAIAKFRDAVTEYEQIIQRNRMWYLSEDIRKLAELASIRLEEISPLINDEYTLIGNYPLNVSAHSSLDGHSPINTTKEY